jgi:hypothetical protein
MRVYVAHTYGRRHGLSEEEIEKNAWLSICVGRELIKKGHKPFIPNLYHFVHSGWDESPEEDVYFDLVSEWIQFCDCLLVARKPTWEGSGVLREIEIAKKLGIKVYYNIGDIE